MSEIKTVLLVPTEGDPHGLLKEGPCGARPPTALSLRVTGDSIDLDTDPRWFSYDAVPDRLMACTNAEILHSVRSPRALVLAWDGEPVAEGMDRAARIDPHYRGEAWASPRNLGAEMERLGYGTIVLLDAEGLEVKE